MHPIQSTALLHRGRSRIGALLLTGAGLFLLSISIGLSVRARSLSPGKLVARHPEVLWRHPAPREASSRLPTIDEAGGTFEVENVGGRPVRILGVQASCGCATPKISPSVIPPGQLGRVDVRTTPFAVGERLVTVDLRTDSPLSPTLNLRLRAFGWRRPPLLLQTGGDLIYRDYDFQGETSPSDRRDR